MRLAPGIVASASDAGVLLPVDFGEQIPQDTDDSGNGNMMVATLESSPYPGILQSLSFHVTTAVGQLRLGVYDEANALVAETAAFNAATGWNTHNVETQVPIDAANYWLCHHPSSSSLHYGSEAGAGATSKLVSRTFGALPATFPGGSSSSGTRWAMYATILVDEDDLPPPGFITHFVGTHGNFSDPSIIVTTIGDTDWYNQNADEAYSLTKLDDFTLRFEEKSTDAPDADTGGNRTEIFSGFPIGPTEVLDIEFEHKPLSLPSDWSSFDWLTIMQCHGEGGGDPVRPFWMFYEKHTGKVGLTMNPDVAYDQDEWLSAGPPTIGEWTKYRIRCQRAPQPGPATGYFQFWVNDVLTVDNQNINVGGDDNYFKLGIYMGPSALNVAAEYRSLNVRLV